MNDKAGEQPDAGLPGEPMTPEQEARLRPRATKFKAKAGHATVLYVEAVRQVHETRQSRTHIERDFSNATPEHVAGNLRRQSYKHRFDVAVVLDPVDGVCAFYVGQDALTAEVESVPETTVVLDEDTDG